MSTATLYDHTGKKQEQITLKKEVFDLKDNPSLIAQAIHVFKANQSQFTSRSQTRSEFSLTKAKWFKQKGTGRARHGAQSAPIFVGGGSAHGPKGIRPTAKRLNSKMRHLALKIALSNLAKNQRITLISNLDKITSKTNSLDRLIRQITPESKVLIVTTKSYPDLQKSSQNLSYLQVSSYTTLDVFKLLNTKHLIIDQLAYDQIINWLTNQKLVVVTAKTKAK